jgi:acetyl esterase/lipase
VSRSIVVNEWPAADRPRKDVSRVADTVVVVTGPSADLDPDNLVRSSGEWGEQCGVAVRSVFAPNEDALVAALTPNALGGAFGVVLNPGEAADSERVMPAADGTGLPVVWVDLLEAERARPPYLRPETMSIRGRGVTGYRWALLHLLQRIAWPYEIVTYGSDARDQVADLRLPTGGGEPYPVAVLLHGGFWRERWERDTIEPLAVDLAQRGFATWNVEYRRVGPYGGGFPTTCDDVAAAIDHLAELAEAQPLDLERVVLVGHSAGGQLALWAAKRVGVDRPPRVRPRLIVALAPVGDVVECARRGLGDTGNAAAAFIGGSPEAHPDRYRAASPQASLPLGMRQVVVQGRLDNIPDLIDLAHRYVRAARAAGDEVEFLELDDADHFDVIDPSSAAWAAVLGRVASVFPEAASA